jgi:hypothetical protein
VKGGRRTEAAARGSLRFQVPMPIWLRTAAVHFRREIQDTEYLHSVRRDGVLVVNEADVTKP